MRRSLLAALILSAAYTASCAAAGPPLERVADITLPGNPTRLDYQSYDRHRHLLFIAHLGDSDVVVVNTQKRRVVSVIPNVSAVHGVLAVPQLNTVYASATGTNEIVAIDEGSLKIKARTAGGVYPDGIAFDPRNGRLFVSDEQGATDTVIDTKTNRRIATIPLGGQVGNTQYDPVSGRIFANVQTLRQLVEIDPVKMRIIRRISLPGCAGNHGLLIDAPARRAFIACEDNAAFLWLDMRAMRVRQRWTVGADPDVLALDPNAHRLYVAAESGVVSVFDVRRAVRRRWQVFLAPAAHTVAVDSQAHAVYFPLENISGHPTLRVMTETAQR
jgi:YVTN family beta-propeller protein